ncbi:hypothetical protein [Sphaerimonospora thailandensis]|nr:hypothetical protein [Sphaerimonospora thailandensis]
MSDDEPIDYEAVRRRFPWVGKGESGESDLSCRYRQIMAEGRKRPRGEECPTGDTRSFPGERTAQALP